MPSLKFPDTGTRYVELPNGKPAVGQVGYLYSDVALTVVAEAYTDVAGVKSDLLPVDTLGRRYVTLDAYGRQPDYWGPEAGTDRLWIVINGVSNPVDADYNSRIDAVTERVTSLESGGASDELALHKAGAETVTGVKTFDVAPVMPVPSASTDPATKAYVDTADGLRLAKASNLSDLASASTARTNLGLGGAATLAVGTTSGTVAAGDDARLSDARTPTTHATSHGSAGADPVTVAQSQVTGLSASLAGKTETTRTISTTAPLTGGGDLSADRTFAISGATTGAVGVVQLTGDLAGTATAPVIASGAVTSAKIADGAIVDGDVNASAAIAQSKISGLVAALAAKADKADLWLNVADYCAYDGITDDSVAFQALLDAVPVAAGNEIGGATLYFPHGVLLLNTVTSGVVAKLVGKPNVKFLGTGAGSRIRTSSATATELLRVETCNAFTMQDILVQAIGTARITHGVHLTCSSPGSVHDAQFRNVKTASNGAYRRTYDIGMTSGSPTIYSAMANFAAGDVGGIIMINASAGPFFTDITAVATLSSTLAADITTTTATTVTLTAALSGAPASGFTIKVGTERMFVSAGGNTTTLTVTRRRGPDLITTTHSAGAAVVTYSATLADNAPETFATAAAFGRIQASGTAVMRNGISIGVTPTGVGNLDIAGTVLSGCAAAGMAETGVRVGNGTAANILDQYAYGLSLAECAIGVYTDGGSLSVFGGQCSTNLMDFKRNTSVSSPVVIDGIRSEGSAMFYEMTGNASAAPATRISSAEIATVNTEDGVVIRHLNSGALLLENVSVKSSDVAAGNVFVVASGSSGSPCHLTVVNFASSGGNLDPFSSSVLPATVKNVINSQRMTPAKVILPNPATGVYFGNRVQAAAGFARGRTAVVDADYTVLNSDTVVAYSSLSAARVVTLPAQGGTLPAGQEFTVKDESGACSGGNTITITPPAGTIDGAASLALNSAYARATVYTNGTNWFTR